MDGQRFDQLARALARGASRRSALKGLVGGVVGGTCAALRMGRARAQCTWTGTFETTIAGSTMTLTEAGGQVSGSYTFTGSDIPGNGTITGVVRTDTSGYTVLEGYWREPEQGGRIWFTMPLDACAQFAGSYTTSDTSSEWIPGWDGIRTNGGIVGDHGGESGGGDGTTGEIEVTLFSNPGDSRVAAYTVEGQAVILFGPKDAEGLVEYISHARVDAADGDPQKRVFLDFAPDGRPTRSALASGEMMLFEWLSDTSVTLTYLSADGSETQVTVDADQLPTDATAALLPGSERWGQGGGEVRLLAYTGVPNLTRTLTESPAALPATQDKLGNEGIIEVRCDSGELVEEKRVTVRGSMKPINITGTMDTMFGTVEAEVTFEEIRPGVFSYSLPIAPAPAPGEGFNKTRFDRLTKFVCAGNFAMFITQSAAKWICGLGWTAGVPGFVSCVTLITGYRVVCALNAGRVFIVEPAIDYFYDTYEVTARAKHPKWGEKQITFNATAGSAIPRGEIALRCRAGNETLFKGESGEMRIDATTWGLIDVEEWVLKSLSAEITLITEAYGTLPRVTKGSLSFVIDHIFPDQLVHRTFVGNIDVGNLGSQELTSVYDGAVGVIVFSGSLRNEGGVRGTEVSDPWLEVFGLALDAKALAGKGSLVLCKSAFLDTMTPQQQYEECRANAVAELKPVGS